VRGHPPLPLRGTITAWARPTAVLRIVTITHAPREVITGEWLLAPGGVASRGARATVAAV
jgi:hypothetical protein